MMEDVFLQVVLLLSQLGVSRVQEYTGREGGNMATWQHDMIIEEEGEFDNSS